MKNWFSSDVKAVLRPRKDSNFVTWIIPVNRVSPAHVNSPCIKGGYYMPISNVNHTCAKSIWLHANELEQRILLICIKLDFT